MQTSKSSIALPVALALALAGCTREAPAPKKEVQIPDGGPPVLTTAERAALAPMPPPSANAQGKAVAQVSYEQTATEPRLLKPLPQWTEQEAAADALGRIGAAAVPELVRALENPDAEVREKAVGVLGRMGPDAAPAVPSLVKLLEDPDLAVRKATARTLGQIGPAAKDAVPSLMRTLLEPASPSEVH